MSVGSMGSRTRVEPGDDVMRAIAFRSVAAVIQ